MNTEEVNEEFNLESETNYGIAEDINAENNLADPEFEILSMVPGKAEEEPAVISEEEPAVISEDKGDELGTDDDVERKKSIHDEGELQTDFFEKVVDEDADKKKVVEQISGMTEREEDANEEDQGRTSVKFEAQIMPPKKTSSKDKIPEENVPEKSEVSERSSILNSESLQRFSVRSSTDTHEAPLPRKSTVIFGMEELVTKSAHKLSLAKSGVTLSRRSTLYSYGELGPRIRDFPVDDLVDEFDFTNDMTIKLFDDVGEIEEEETPYEEEPDLPALERGPYYTKYDSLVQDIASKKIKNFIMQKKLAMYFKRKKISYAAKDADWSFDAQNKYHRILLAYGELTQYETMERLRISDEIKTLKANKIEKCSVLKNMFQKMQDREMEVGKGLINTKTGFEISDKLLERLIRRQSYQMSQVSTMRLSFIRLKGMVQEKLDAISAVDEIGPNLLLADYEQLKMENRSYADKIEERDEELNKLRAKCANSIQVLAHMREKSSAMENDLYDFKKQLRAAVLLRKERRAKLNNLKQERDCSRNQINTIRDESGLLTQPTLLHDMENELNELETERAHLIKLQNDHKKRAKQILTIRKKMEEAADMRRTIRRKSNTKIHLTEQTNTTMYQRKPSLLMPTIDPDAFNGLAVLKPKMTSYRYHNRSKRIDG